MNIIDSVMNLFSILSSTAEVDLSNIAHRQQHTPALPDGSAAAQEANDQQHSTHCN